MESRHKIHDSSFVPVDLRKIYKYDNDLNLYYINFTREGRKGNNGGKEKRKRTAELREWEFTLLPSRDQLIIYHNIE